MKNRRSLQRKNFAVVHPGFSRSRWPISVIFLALSHLRRGFFFRARTNKWNVKWLVRQVDIKTKLIFVVFFSCVHYVSPVDAFNKMFSFSVSTSLRESLQSSESRSDYFRLFSLPEPRAAADDTELIEPEKGRRDDELITSERSVE
jgi:hypothetical protein